MAANRKTVFWLAGENSGDLHAAGVIERLPGFRHIGIGGPRMQKHGLNPLFEFERFSVMGFLEVLIHLPFFLRVEKKIKQRFSSYPPDLIVLVDYPGLNMRIARLAAEYGIPVLYYICPQFWAWKHKRIYDLKRFTDHVAFILPFEERYMLDHGIKSTFVGHPIAEEIVDVMDRVSFADKYGLDPRKTWLGFLPGSRDHEIKRILPQYLKGIRSFEKERFEFLISKAPTITDKVFKRIINRFGIPGLKVIETDNYAIMKHSRALLVTSGTATLETAYIGTPFIIVYRATMLSYQIGRRLIKLDRIGLPNIVLNKKILPELIQYQVRGKNLHRELTELLENTDKYNGIVKELQYLHKLLGKKSASLEVAKIIRDMLDE